NPKNGDSDVDGDLLSIVSINGTTLTGGAQTIDTPNGTITIDASDAISFSPDANYNGTETFAYVISDGTTTATANQEITVNAVNDDPVAVADAPVTDEDTPVSGLVTATDIDGDSPLTFTKASDPSNGTVTVAGDGSYTYTPDADFNGTDSFTVSVSDGNGGTDTVTVSVTVNEVDVQTDQPIAMADSFTVVENTVLQETVSFNDTLSNDGSNSWTPIDLPANGTLTFNPNGQFTYTPTQNYVGTDSFTYQLCDADNDCSQTTVNIEILAAPAMLLDKVLVAINNSNSETEFSQIGDEIHFAISIHNTGGINLTAVKLTDLLTEDEWEIGQIEPGQSLVFNTIYKVTQADLDRGYVKNTATATAPEITEPEIEESNEVMIYANQNPELSLSEFIDYSTFSVIGESLTFTYEVVNTGNITLTNVAISDALAGLIGLDCNATTLAPGEVLTCTSTYIVQSQDLISGKIESRATATSEETEAVFATAGASHQKCLKVYNEFSPNGDGANDRFYIECIEKYPNNHLKIYNRWGNVVYTANGYANEWDGSSNGRATFNESTGLPVGTYYYILNLGDGSEPLVGWLYLNR
uniref:Ig-like domain-containing protein n=1 Tax=Mangrovibacterium sp. TaxID=1961364 RepID=UPI0035699EBB